MNAVTLITKVCKDCGEEKPASEFHKNRRAPQGLNTYCKPCAAIRVQAREDRLRAELGEEEYRRRRSQAVRRSRLKPAVRERSRLSGRVQNEALRRLRENHRAEYDHLLAVVWSEAERGEFE